MRVSPLCLLTLFSDTVQDSFKQCTMSGDVQSLSVRNILASFDVVAYIVVNWQQHVASKRVEFVLGAAAKLNDNNYGRI